MEGVESEPREMGDESWARPSRTWTQDLEQKLGKLARRIQPRGRPTGVSLSVTHPDDSVVALPWFAVYVCRQGRDEGMGRRLGEVNYKKRRGRRVHGSLFFTRGERIVFRYRSFLSDQCLPDTLP